MNANAGKGLEDYATSNSTTISSATALTVKSPTIPGAGREPLVVGSAFSLNQGDVSGLIKGETGVFMIEVVSKEEAPALDNYITYANALQSTNSTKVNLDVYNALKENAEIEDNRAIFY